MSPSRERFERLFSIIALLLYSGGFVGFIGVTNPLYRGVQLLGLLVFLVTVFLLARRWKAVVYLLVQEKFVLLILALVMLSATWSILPTTETLYRFGGLSGLGIVSFVQITLFGIYFATRYSLGQQFRLLAWMFAIAIPASFVVAMLLPHYGVMGSMATTEDLLHAGSWKGIYVHKNILGNMMALGAIALLTLAGDAPRHRWILNLGAGLAVGLVLLSKSVTALVTLPVLFLLLHLYKTLRWRDRLLIPFTLLVLVIGGCCAFLLLNHYETVLLSLGRDPTLTGRSNIWSAVIEKIHQRFWLGYGYHTFWTAVSGDLLSLWSPFGRMRPTHAHNGFLDLWLDLGVVGFGMFVVSFISNLIKGIRLVGLTHTHTALLPLLLLTYLLLLNQAESALVREGVFWILYVSISISFVAEFKALRRRFHDHQPCDQEGSPAELTSELTYSPWM